MVNLPGPPTSDLGARLRIVYFGTPSFAVPSLEALLRSRHEVVALVSQPDRHRGRGQHLQPTPTKEVALAHNLPVLQPTRIKDDVFLQSIRDLGPDLGIVAAFGRILPQLCVDLGCAGAAETLPAHAGGDGSDRSLP